MIEATVICDSISTEGHRLTTFKLRYQRFIHSEFMTHRVISRNASSSRAIPTAKLLEEVRSDALRAAPVWWGKNQPGMQAAEELASGERRIAQEAWARAAHFAADMAEAMQHVGVHKQIVNRLLEPFSHINVVASATEWDNFFGLRLHPDAQPEMRELAKQMWTARQASEPNLLKPGEWHLPFVKTKDAINSDIDSLETLIRVSVARCARVSYESFETGKRSTVEEDLKLFDRLVGSQPLHASPAEHQATPDTFSQTYGYAPATEVGPIIKSGWNHPNEWGNLKGWRQFRKTLPGEACAPLPSYLAD